MRRLVTVVTVLLVVLTIGAWTGWRSLARSEDPWDRATPVGERGLTVEWVGGSCDDDWQVTADESDDEVRVLVRTRVTARSCDDVGVPRERTITLDAPLGRRGLVDVACEDDNKAGWAPCLEKARRG